MRRSPARYGFTGLAVGALAAACIGLGWWLKPAEPMNSVAYGNERIHTINAHLRQAAADYAFLAGDSFVEHYAAEPLPCGWEQVNGGISGLKAADYLHILDALRFQHPPRTALLAIGLNDLQTKHEPGDPLALARFRDSAARLIGRLDAAGAHVVVAAIPPIPAQTARFFDTRSFGSYSEMLRGICRAPGCTFVDPFASARDGAFWRGKADTSRDGIHLDALRSLYATISGALCSP